MIGLQAIINSSAHLPIQNGRFHFLRKSCDVGLAFRYLTIITLFSYLIAPPAAADEKLRIIGMGGVKVGASAPDAGIFGNPAALLSVKANHLSAGLSVENYRYENLPEPQGSQFFATLNFDSRPSVYYSRVFGDFGVSVGYAGVLESSAEFVVERTRSEYVVDQRRFSAKTVTAMDYNLLWKSGWRVGGSFQLADSWVGVRLKRLTQTVKRGQILSVLDLESQHGSDINVNDPRELIPAIIDSLDLADPAKYFDSTDEPSQDLTVGKFELDLGYQRDFSIEALGERPIRAGLIVENLFQRKLVERLPFQLGVGAVHEPFDWLIIGADIWRVFGHRGLDAALGWELHKSWQRGFNGATALRGGLSRVNATGAFSVGLSFALGSLHLEYTLNKRFKNQPLGEAMHLFASTVRF
jgi:hypothetical protein